MKYTIYKNDVGQLMAMEGHCEFDGVVAQAIDYDAVKNALLRAGKDQPETPHEHYWFNLGHQSNKIAEENNVLRAENARLNDELKKYTHLERIEHGRFVAESLKVENLKTENARLREALEWMIKNQSLIIFAEDEDHVLHFMTKAREALKGGE